MLRPNRKTNEGSLVIDTATLIAILGLVGMVIVGGALLSGPVERTGLPALAVFLLLGLLIGPYGLDLFTVTLEDPLLRVVATLSLTLVCLNERRHERPGGAGTATRGVGAGAGAGGRMGGSDGSQG
jgi:hypothetical protein